MRLKASAAILALVIFLSFAISVPRTRDTGLRTISETAISIPTVAIRDSFKKGVHAFSGTLEAPNACGRVSAAASLLSGASSTESILVALTLEQEPGVCLEVPTKITFETTLEAAEDLPITVTVNGLIASTTPS